jgi:hypothetical protein
VTPRDAAVNFEGIKVKLSQGRDGMLVTFAIHPDEIPPELVRAFVGSRWMCALVRLGDDDMPAPTQGQVDGTRAVQSAAMLCRTPAFQQFLVDRGVAPEATEDAATEGLRRYLGISSRADLKGDAAARELFATLKARFERSRSPPDGR